MIDRSRHEFDTLQKRNQYALLAYCRKICSTRIGFTHVEAEDILQEALIKAWNAFGTYRRDSSFRVWVSFIALNVVRDYCRSSHRRIPSVNFDQVALSIVEKGPSLELTVLSNMGLNRLLGRVQEVLTPTQFDVLIAITVQEFSYKETAKLFQLPVGTIRSNVSRSKHKCREKLAQFEYQ